MDARRLVRVLGTAALPVAATLAQLGCARTDPARFYLLAPVAPVGAATAAGSPLGLRVSSLPDYLRRPELATRRSPHEVEYDSFSRWAEPLEESVPAVLAANLARVRGVPRVPLYPWTTGAPPERVANVRIVRFDASPEGAVVLEADVGIGGEWRVESVAEQASSARAEAVVAAQSAALAELARRIAAR